MGRVFGVLFVLSLVACGKVTGQSEAPGWDPISPPGPGSFVLADALYQPGATALQRSPLTVPTSGAHVASPLSSGTSPVAIPTPDGSGLLFSTWKYYGGPPSPGTEPTTGVCVAHPAIWLLNLETGVQSLVADGSVSLALSMTLLPALMALFADRLVKPGRIFGRGRSMEHGRPGGFWDTVSRGVMARPWVWLILHSSGFR